MFLARCVFFPPTVVVSVKGLYPRCCRSNAFCWVEDGRKCEVNVEGLTEGLRRRMEDIKIELGEL